MVVLASVLTQGIRYEESPLFQGDLPGEVRAKASGSRRASESLPDGRAAASKSACIAESRRYDDGSSA